VLYVITYDIADDRRRLRLAERLLDFGIRVQESVFEALLDEPGLTDVRAEIARITDDQEDSVRIYAICESCRPRSEIHGRGEPTERARVFIV